MKKYFVEIFITFTEKDGREDFHDTYECEDYEMAKKYTGRCVRLIDVNTYKEGKRKALRKQLKRAKLVTIDKLAHWESFEVIIWENGTDNIVQKWEA